MSNKNLELTREDEVFPILDSKLITPTLKNYDIKLVDCENYVQVYYYEVSKTKNISQKDTSDLELKKIKLNKFDENLIELNTQEINELFEGIDNKSENKETKLENSIQERNIIRSKLECQRIAKTNIEEWKTFITLTFEENINDVAYANKRFRYFVDKVRRIKKDFKYLCITEFQKRGATHYHMLCNIDINDTRLIYSQEDNPKFKHIKYWLDGFTSVEVMKDDPKKIIGYIAKYMTKNIDNRLFGHRRYFYSKNLKVPSKSYIDTSQDKELKFYNKKIQDMELIYQNDYINPYDNTKVTYFEFQKPFTSYQDIKANVNGKTE